MNWLLKATKKLLPPYRFATPSVPFHLFVQGGGSGLERSNNFGQTICNLKIREIILVSVATIEK